MTVISNSQAVAKRTKILLVSNRVMHYRIPVYNYFSQRFREMGVDFSVLADRVQEQSQTAPEFHLQEVPFKFSKYRKIIKEVNPDAVILFLRLKEKIAWPLMHWFKLRGTPFAVWSKGGNWDAKNSRFRYQVFNYVHHLSDAMILYSQSCQEFVKLRYRHKAFIANNTLNFYDFPQINESKEEIKQEFNIPFKKVVIFVGRMGSGKGRKRVDHLIDMFRALPGKDVGLVLVGSGLSEQLKGRINTLNTIHLGEVHDAKNIQISKLCKMADVCAIPGHVGLGLNQAFFWGLPVVTEECDHPPEIAYLQPGRNGFIVPHNDTEALRDRILYLLNNDDVRGRFSENAREDIMREASIERMFAGFEQCVKHLTWN